MHASRQDAVVPTLFTERVEHTSCDEAEHDRPGKWGTSRTLRCSEVAQIPIAATRADEATIVFALAVPEWHVPKCILGIENHHLTVFFRSCLVEQMHDVVACIRDTRQD